jgi:hypothetical protein
MIIIGFTSFYPYCTGYWRAVDWFGEDAFNEARK